METGYKVTRRLNWHNEIQYVSVHSMTEVRYIPNQWVEPPPLSGPLCVFDTFEHAMDFVIRGGEKGEELAVWECEYEPVTGIPLFYDSTGSHIIYVELLPEGTILANKVKILRKVI